MSDETTGPVRPDEPTGSGKAAGSGEPAGSGQPAGLSGSTGPGTTAEPKPEFTKAPQPELPLELRKEKAGWNKNRVAIWIAVAGFGLYLIINGVVGILTKAR